jgi:carbamoyltransferase
MVRAHLSGNVSEVNRGKRSVSTTILGFSGLARFDSYKRKHLSDLTESEYAVVQGADAAAALVVDGKVIGAAAQERFDGVKHSADFPAGAADWCLRSAHRSVQDIDLVAHSFSYGGERDFFTGQATFYQGLYEDVLDPRINQRIAEERLGIDLTGKFVPVQHHLAHAARAYLPSGFDEAAVVVSDGLGERNSVSAYLATRAGYQRLLQLPAHSSLGLLYGLVTMYLGFRFGDGEYKVMGLAPLGDPARYTSTFLEKFLILHDDGTYSIPLLLENVTDIDKESHRPALRALAEELGPPRPPGASIEQRHMDLAAAVQASLEAAQFHLLRHVRGLTGASKVCLAGGVALNCVMNGKLLRSKLFDDVFVQPAAGDDGAALGAAMYVAQEHGMTTSGAAYPLLGPAYGAEECAKIAAGRADVAVTRFDDDDSLAVAVAELIANGSVVGWFQGPMEFGPRALGSRSILADPRSPDMRNRINRMVKKREWFRPFAPAVIEERAADLFEIDPADRATFESMLFVAYVRDDAPEIPAVTHVDGTARVQTVRRSRSPRFWALIDAFGQLAGVPVVLNTSFNVAGQPIVRTPEQAIDTFVDAGLDALVLDRLLLTPSVSVRSHSEDPQ